MDHSKVEAVLNGGARTIQTRGTVTIPKRWRDKHDLSPGDHLVFIENDDGFLEVVPADVLGDEYRV